MNKTWLIGILIISIVGFSNLAYSHSMGCCGRMGGSYWSGRNMGPMHMGRMMGYPNYGWQYYGWQCPMYNTMNYGSYYDQSKPLTKSDAKKMAEEYLKDWNNPNLKIGKLSEKKNEFEIQIVTKNNSLVQKLMIDKQNGTTRIEF